MSDVEHNREAGRFEIAIGSDMAVLEYALADGRIVFVHTGVPSALEGRGLGSQLARAGLEFARGESLRVEPRCPFIRSYIDHHPEYKPLVSA
jgi:uncharacterized protein